MIIKPCSLEKHHLTFALACAYVIAAATVVHILTRSMGVLELSTPPLCMHKPFAGISHAFMLGPPVHDNKFMSCAVNASLSIIPLPNTNLSDAGLSLSNIYHITTATQGIIHDVDIHTLQQAAQFFAFLDALRRIGPGQRALVLENTAVLAPHPKWIRMHELVDGLHFDLARIEPCGGTVLTHATNPPVSLQHCMRRCFSPWEPASAIITHSGAQKLLRYAAKETQAYDIAWFQGLVHMVDSSFALFCATGLDAHAENEEWKRAKRGTL